MVDEPEEEQQEEDEDTLLYNDHDQNDSDVDDEYHGNVLSQQTGLLQSSDSTPFWNDIPHYEAIDEDYPNEDILDVG
ncbi:hypothetical protein K1719_032128 [Acacia pycnantha]|nr:hypothetical protein K1719_032128 [Acacia pycnantha]